MGAPRPQEIACEPRFEFGENWQRFLSVLDETRIAEAERSLRSMLKVETLAGKSFLDIGSGSGLFSLAAMRLGAERVHSFDYDPRSVACTQELKRRYFPDTSQWSIAQGSALDAEYVKSLGPFDVVYSWGVLHHTGNLWQALENVVPAVASSGALFIAIYNYQPFLSALWTMVKRAYNRMPRPGRWLMARGFFVFFAIQFFVADLVQLRNPLTRYTGQGRRGMSVYRDVLDWIGGYPFEVATPEAIFRFYRDRGFVLRELKTCGGRHGCNEFVFLKGARGF